MNKKIILWISMFILIAFTVSAVGSNSPSDYKFWDGGDVRYNGSFTNASNGDLISSYMWKLFGGTDALNIYNNSQAYDGALSLLLNLGASSSPQKVNIADFSPLVDVTNYTLAFWYKFDGSPGANGWGGIEMKDGGNDILIFPIREQSSATHYGGYDYPSATPFATGFPVSSNWEQFAVYFEEDNENMTMYHWNTTTEVWDYMYHQPSGTFSSPEQVRLGADEDEVFIDNFRMWNGTINDEPQGVPPYVPPNNVNLTTPSIANNTQFAIPTLSFNTTGNFSNSSVNTNCSLYFNDSVNETKQFSAGIGIGINYSKTFQDGSYTYYINCTDGVTMAGTQNNTFHIDTTNPTITWNIPENGGTYAEGNVTISTNVTLADANLYSYYFNLTYVNGTVINQTNSTSLTGQTSYNINDVFNISTYGQILKGVVQVCDGHTAQHININPRKRSDGLYFDDVKISMQDGNNYNGANYYKKKDRYEFTYNTKTPSVRESFFVEGENYVDVLHNKTEYLGHLVVDGKYWVDFEMADIKDVSVIRLSDKKVMVVVTSEKSKTNWEFKSIGELNCITQTRNFLAVNHSYYGEGSVLADSSTTFYINLTYNATYVTTIDADLWYNNTRYTMTETAGADKYQYSRTITTQNSNGSIPYHFEYNIDGQKYNTTSQTQTTYKIDIDNCSAYSTVWLNVSIRDELNNSRLKGDLDYYFEWSGGGYNGSIDSVNNYSFCVYPEWANFTSDVTVKYDVTNYDIRYYVVDDYQVDNYTEQVDLYALRSVDSTAVTVHVTDERDRDVSNAFIEAYRRDIATNQSLLVSTKFTDGEGNAIFNLKTTGEQYRFIVYRDGDKKYEDAFREIVATTIEIKLIEVSTSRLTEYLQIKNIKGNVDYDNNTYQVTFIYDDSVNNIADNYCLNVTDFNRTIFSNCSTSADGTLVGTITEYNKTYVALGLARYSGSNRWYKVDERFIDTRTGWEVIGSGNRLMFGWIILLTVGLLFLVNKSIAVGGLCAGTIMLYLFGIWPITFGMVMTVCSIGALVLFAINKRQEL